MAEFSKTSLDMLSTCHEDLQALFKAVVEKFDCTVICGHRGMEAQELAYKQGRSKQHWPTSKHNSDPSHAVDVAPFPIDWGDRNRFYFFAGYVKSIADQMGIRVRWGGDFDGSGKLNKTDTFIDLPHWEIVE